VRWWCTAQGKSTVQGHRGTKRACFSSMQSTCTHSPPHTWELQKWPQELSLQLWILLLELKLVNWDVYISNTSASHVNGKKTRGHHIEMHVSILWVLKDCSAKLSLREDKTLNNLKLWANVILKVIS
jgi:hypothetical protein